MASIRIRYWAAARTAAGVAEEQVEAANCAAALAQAIARREDPAPLQRVVDASSFLVAGVRRDRALLESIEGPVDLEVLPPFAGG